MTNISIGYIFNIINKKFSGIIATNRDYFIYYTDNEDLNDFLHIIYYKHINKLIHKNQDIFIEKITAKDKLFLHNLSYVLPFPYHIEKLIYKQINTVNDLYIIFNDLKMQESMG